MAYMSQERKKELTPRIKSVLQKYGMKGTVGVRHHSSLVVNIAMGRLDFGPDDYVQINQYHFRSHYADKPEVVAFLTELIAAMNVGNWDKSEIQYDYFDVGWYIDINIGRWNKPYVRVA